MMNYLFKTMTAALMVVIALGAIGCSSGQDQSDPKQVVIQMFGAMERNDAAALAHLLDLTALMKDTGEHYALSGGEPKVYSNPQEILEDLTGEGQTKKRWFSYQRIVNECQITGTTATVEVTFVDKERSKGYMTKFGLKQENGKWRIYTFQTLQEAPSEE